MLSVVIPAFNEQEMVPAAAGQIDGILSRAGIPHELIFIDDGSRDATWAEIRAESEHRDTVRGVHFSRNFRKEAAIFAGLQAADGDCVAVIDCDLQHPPEKLVEMYRLWEQSCERETPDTGNVRKEVIFHTFTQAFNTPPRWGEGRNNTADTRN